MGFGPGSCLPPLCHSLALPCALPACWGHRDVPCRARIGAHVQGVATEPSCPSSGQHCRVAVVLRAPSAANGRVHRLRCRWTLPLPAPSSSCACPPCVLSPVPGGCWCSGCDRGHWPSAARARARACQLRCTRPPPRPGPQPIPRCAVTARAGLPESRAWAGLAPCACQGPPWLLRGRVRELGCGGKGQQDDGASVSHGGRHAGRSPPRPALRRT